jgi:hypothetical protein
MHPHLHFRVDKIRGAGLQEGCPPDFLVRRAFVATEMKMDGHPSKASLVTVRAVLKAALQNAKSLAHAQGEWTPV